MPVKSDPFLRFWTKVSFGWDCWEWTGCRTWNGYGQFWDGKRVGLAHRYAYETMVGPIPAGLLLDHLCRNKACVNPSHLEPVTNYENLRRGNTPIAWTACERGHEYTQESTHWTRDGHRQCRICRRQLRRERSDSLGISRAYRYKSA